MKLYYSAGACSTSCHITLEESGLKYETVAIDFDNTADPNVAVVNKLNPLGTLPILITDDGKQLDQNLAIHLYVASKAADKKLFPTPASGEYIEALNLLTFVATDLHKAIGTLWSVPAISKEKSVQEPVRKFMLEKANSCLSYLNLKLNGKDYLLGKSFSVIDAYAFVVTNWTQWLEIPLTPYKNVQTYLKRVAERPAVAKVLKEEESA